MRKITQQISKLFLQHTPAYTRPVVQKTIKASNIESIKEDIKISPMIHYIQSLQKHKQYLDFFQIGVVRDQRKKIQNVAKYVGLAIRDYSQSQMDAKLGKQNEKNVESSKQKAKQDLSNHSQIIKNWVGTENISNEVKQQKQSTKNKQEAHQKSK